MNMNPNITTSIINITSATNSSDEAKKFKQFFHQNEPTVFMLVAPSKAKNGKAGSTPTEVLTGLFKKCWTDIQRLNQEGYNAYMTINTMAGNVRKNDNTVRVNALFIDYDKGDWSADDLDQFLTKFGVKPHMVVETSPGNYHVYWRVKGVQRQQFKPTQQQLAHQFNADTHVCDLARVMRMPGTVNHNHGDPFLARIVYIDVSPPPIKLAEFKHGMFGSAAGAPSLTSTATAEEASSSSLASGAATPIPMHRPAKTGPKLDADADADSDVARVEAALRKIPADDRKVWITIGMALKNGFGDSGLSMFREWSMKSARYDSEELDRQWQSLKVDGGITLGTLFWQSAQYATSEKVGSNGETEPPTNLLQLTKHFAKQSAKHLRHCEDNRSWYACGNGRWEKSPKAALRIATRYLQDQLAAPDGAATGKHRALIESQQSPAAARELLRAAESDAALSCTPDAFELAPHFLGVELPTIPDTVPQYGVIDLALNQFRYAVPSDMLSRLAGATYDPSATCPLWMTFLEQITVGDTDLADFLQLAVGYTLYGHTNEQVMFILIGSGGNGKGVFTRIIYLILGEFSAVMQSNLLKPGAISANNPSPALMQLNGKRFWAGSEVPRGMVLDEGLTKQLTGGDLISSRGLYADQVEFLPVGKLWLSVNDMPRVRHDDQGMWRRIVAIPFKAVFKGTKRDNSLEDKLKAELPGILNWALEGARKYQEKGKLGRPKASRMLLASLLRDADTVGVWIGSCCLEDDGGKLQSKAAYDSYVEAMKREKSTALSQKEFKADLERRGYTHKSSGHFNYHQGLTIKTD